MKSCPFCKLEKLETEFRKGRKGLFTYCKPCSAEYFKRWKKKTREELRAKYPLEYSLWNNAQKSAAKKKLPFNLKIDDIVVPKNCPILGVEMKKQIDGGSYWNMPTVDRLDSSKGYTKDNVSIISWRANTVKNFGTVSEHIQIAKWMEQRKEELHKKYVQRDWLLL